METPEEQHVMVSCTKHKMAVYPPYSAVAMHMICMVHYDSIEDYKQNADYL